MTALAKVTRFSGLGTLEKIVTCSVKPAWNEHSQLLRVFVRFSGEPEYQVSDTTNLFTNAIIQEDPISEEEYYAF